MFSASHSNEARKSQGHRQREQRASDPNKVRKGPGRRQRARRAEYARKIAALDAGASDKNVRQPALDAQIEPDSDLSPPKALSDHSMTFESASMSSLVAVSALQVPVASNEEDFNIHKSDSNLDTEVELNSSQPILPDSTTSKKISWADEVIEAAENGKCC